MAFDGWRGEGRTVAFVAEAGDGDAGCLAAHYEIGVMARHVVGYVSESVDEGKRANDMDCIEFYRRRSAAGEIVLSHRTL